MGELKADPASSTLTLSLIGNAYDSFAESLAKVAASDGQATAWKYAVLHIVHSVELMIKERLHRAHPLLLWENVDRRTRTVSLDHGLERLVAAGIEVSAFERAAIKAAIEWRNQITHYKVDLRIDEVRENYLLLFEFLNGFHHEHFDDSLTDHLTGDALRTASALMEHFRTDMVDFRGRSIHRTWVWKLLAAQEIPVLSIASIEHARIKYGHEAHWSEPEYQDFVPKEFCRDCACAIGELHGPSCVVEDCPRCGAQMLTCDCEFDDSHFWGLMPFPDDDLDGPDEELSDDPEPR